MKKAITITAMIGLISPIVVCAADTGAAYHVHVRSLAASCAACHGTQGNAVPASGDENAIPALAGAAKADMITKLQAFKSGKRTATVMHRHAKGLTDDEIIALAEYFSMQVPQAASILKPQKLRTDHAN